MDSQRAGRIAKELHKDFSRQGPDFPTHTARADVSLVDKAGQVHSKSFSSLSFWRFFDGALAMASPAYSSTMELE
jgi:hypothetical protein